MSQGSTYIKRMSLGFLDNRILWNQKSPSPFSMPPLLPLFSSMPKCWVSHFPHVKSLRWFFFKSEEWGEEKEDYRSRSWSRSLNQRVDLSSEVEILLREEESTIKISVWDWSRWISIEIGYVCGSNIYESMIIGSSEYLPALRYWDLISYLFLNFRLYVYFFLGLE